jgi:hypothetical protein
MHQYFFPSKEKHKRHMSDPVSMVCPRSTYLHDSPYERVDTSDVCRQMCESNDDCGAYTTTLTRNYDSNDKFAKKMECRLIDKNMLSECEPWSNKSWPTRLAWSGAGEMPRDQNAVDTNYYGVVAAAPMPAGSVMAAPCKDGQFLDGTTCKDVCKHPLHQEGQQGVTSIENDRRDQNGEATWRYGPCGFKNEPGVSCCRRNNIGESWRFDTKTSSDNNSSFNEDQVFSQAYLNQTPV